MEHLHSEEKKADREEIDIADYLRVLRRHIFLFFAVFGAVAAAGILYTFTIQPIYKAEIELEIQEGKEKELDVLNSLGGIRNEMIITEIEKIRSRDIARKVCRNLHLGSSVRVLKGDPDAEITAVVCSNPGRLKPSVFLVRFLDPDGNHILESAEGTHVGTFGPGECRCEAVSYHLALRTVSEGDVLEVTCRHIERAVDTVINNTSVSRVGDTSIVSIAAEHRFPERAKEIADEFFNVYSSENLSEKNASAREVNRFIRKRMDFYNEKLNSAASELQDFKEKNNIFSLSSSNNALVEQISRIDSCKALKEVELANVKKTVSMVNGPDKEFNLPGIFPPQSALEQLSVDLSKLQVTRDKLLSKLTPNHPRVAEVNIQINRLRSTILEKLDLNSKVLENEIASLESKLEEYESRVQSLPGLDKKIVKKMRDVRFYEEMVLQMAKKSEESSILEASTLSSVKVTEQSVLPAVPVSPRKLINILLSLIAASVSGLGVVFLREYVDDSLIAVEEVQNILHEEPLAVIPFQKKRFTRNINIDRSSGLGYLHIDSPVTEAFKTLKTAVEFADMGADVHVYQITSSVAGEGKSTITANLGITFANSGAKTLIVDSDHRNPMIHRIMECENSVGFVESVYGNVKPLETVQDTSIENLYIVPSGINRPNIVKLSLPLAQIRSIFEEFRPVFDYILIDTPPVLAFDDSLRIASAADRLLFVAGLGTVTKEALKRALNKSRTGSSSLAVIVNDRKECQKYNMSAYGYYSYYPYGKNGERQQDNEEKDWRILVK